jgi:hypothetical protein
MNDHFMPVEKPAPPRPCKPASFNRSTTFSGDSSVSALRAAS